VTGVVLALARLERHSSGRLGVSKLANGEDADEILDDGLRPFLDDLARRAKLGFAASATEIAAGVLRGLYAGREAGSETLPEPRHQALISRSLGC
jgi:hypothetical protein